MSNTSPFDNLVDRNEIAHILDVVPTAVSNYVAQTNKKHAPFPEPVITRSLGRFRLWDIDDVRTWHTSTFPKRSSVWESVDDRLSEFRDHQEDPG